MPSGQVCADVSNLAAARLGRKVSSHEQVVAGPQPIGAPHTDGKHMAVLIQQRPQRVHISGPLMHQAFSATENRRARLMLNCLALNEAHLWLSGCDNDRLGIGRVIRLSFHEWPDVLRRDRPHLVPD